jgi:hypothetical protein
VAWVSGELAYLVMTGAFNSSTPSAFQGGVQVGDLKSWPASQRTASDCIGSVSAVAVWMRQALSLQGACVGRSWDSAATGLM